MDEIHRSVDNAVDKQTKQLYSLLKKINDANYKVLNQTQNYTKHIYNMVKEECEKHVAREDKINNIYNSIINVEKQLQQTNKSVNENQSNLMTIITEFMNISSKDKSYKAETEQVKIKAEFEERKQKIIFWTKLVSMLVGSGGVLFLVVDSIIRAIGG
jgi:septation ring formation regulator EzrA